MLNFPFPTRDSGSLAPGSFSSLASGYFGAQTPDSFIQGGDFEIPHFRSLQLKWAF